MIERHDEDSQWAPFWACLPQQLHSGLSMSDGLVQALEGIPAHAEIVNSRQVSTTAVSHDFACACLRSPAKDLLSQVSRS